MTTPIDTRQQIAAVAFLRWRLFRNALQRRGGTAELVGRVIIYTLFSLFLATPIVSAGFAGWATVALDAPAYLPVLLWIVFFAWMFVSVNISPPALAFDPTALIRFPVNFPAYLAIRLLLGLLSASTVIGSLALLSAAIGIGVASVRLFPWVLLTFAAFALGNVLLVRMALIWIDRWLATRRTREIFTSLFFLAAIGIQIAGMSVRSVMRHAVTHPGELPGKPPLLLNLLRRIQPLADFLPPSLAVAAIQNLQNHHPIATVIRILAILGFATLFLAIFALRLQREFDGENFSETAAIPTPAAPTSANRPRLAPSLAWTLPGLNPTSTATFQKEVIYLRRSGAALYAQLTPLVMVYFFTLRGIFFGRSALWTFPSALAYILLGISATFYNAFGHDLAGVQFYFLAPIRIRDVLLAKNLITFILIVIQAAIVFAAVTFAGRTPPPTILVATLLWTVGATLANATLGNHRSITSPKRTLGGKLNKQQASQASILLSLAVLFGSSALGGLILLGAGLLHHLWLAIPTFAALALAAIVVYTSSLNRLDATARSHRESLTEELCKT